MKGFEVVINGRKWFAFSLYAQDGDNVTSICNTTFQSSSHDVGVNPKNWSCFKGVKLDSSQTDVKVQRVKNSQLLEEWVQFSQKQLLTVNMLTLRP